MIINTNLASLNTVRQLGVNEKATQSSLAKLSSGLRINSAADDAAGLAISEKMRGQISGLNKATSNAQDGISMVGTAEGSLSETTSILQRMRELAVQGSNDTNTTNDRTAMQTEMNQLTSEVNRIGNTTQFNTQNLLNGGGITTDTTVTTMTTGAAKGNMGTAAGQAAIFDSGAITAMANDDAGKTFTFNGVTITVATATALSTVAAAATSNLAGTVTISNALGATATGVADAVKAVFALVKTTGGATSVLANFTANATGATNVQLTDTLADGATNNNLPMGGTLTLANATNSTQLTTLGITAGSGAAVTQKTASVAAVANKWDAGLVTTALADGTSGTLTFNGVQINLAATTGAANATTNVTATTATLTLATGQIASQQVDQIVSALTLMKAQGGAALANMSFANASGHLQITDTLADGATNASAQIATTGMVIANTTSLAQETVSNGGQAGVTEARGQYTFNISSSFEAAGATVRIGGGTFTAVTANADPTKGQFNIGTDAETQAKSLAAAVNASATLGQRFDATVSGSTITLTEQALKATGTNLSNAAITNNTAVQGKYEFSVENPPVAVGGKYTIGGQDIKVTSDASDAGIASGTSVLYDSTVNGQAAKLSQAISVNTQLNSEYNTSATGNIVTLTQKAGSESMTGVVASTDTSAKNGFEATFQIGANTGQTMTVQIGDMRSQALGISGTTAGATVTAANGAQASLVAVKSASNGSDNNDTEYTLDLSTADKATAAISVIDDAINKVSAERSNLGAVQNRLEHTINNLGTSAQNITTAEANIRDVDMAKEMTNFQKNNILQQAAQAMLAQANQQPQGVLQLLR